MSKLEGVRVLQEHSTGGITAVEGGATSWPMVRPAAGVALAAFLVALAMLAVPVGSLRAAMGNLALILGPAAALLATYDAGRHARSTRERRAWTLLVLGATAALAGQVAWATRELVLGQPVPFPSEAFVLFVAFHLLVAAAAIVALRPARDPQRAMEIGLDGLLVLLAAAALGLRFALEEPLVNGWLETNQAAAILIGQVTTAASFFFTMLLLIWKDTDLPTPVVRGLAATMAVFLLGNILTVTGVDPNPARSGDPAELLWLGGWLILAISGMSAARKRARSRRASPRADAARRVRHFLIPASALFLAAAATDAFYRAYFTVASAVILLTLGAVLAIRIVNALGATERQAERRRRAEAEAGRARVRTVVARLHPHFVLNTLNAVAELIRLRDPAAEESVYRLSSLIRYTLEAGDQELVPLRRELQLTREYLDLERLRYGDRLRVRVSVERAARRHPVPPFVLQPLVENAVRHGVGRSPQGGTVRLRAKMRNGYLAVEVADDGPGTDPDRGSDTSGIGLRGVRAQLLSHYGDGARIRVRTGPGEGFVIRLRIPRPAET